MLEITWSYTMLNFKITSKLPPATDVLDRKKKMHVPERKQYANVNNCLQRRGHFFFYQKFISCTSFHLQKSTFPNPQALKGKRWPSQNGYPFVNEPCHKISVQGWNKNNGKYIKNPLRHLNTSFVNESSKKRTSRDMLKQLLLLVFTLPIALTK